MATTVMNSFEDYKSNLELTERQANLVSTRRSNIESALTEDLTLHPEKTKVIGSWDRRTLTRYLSEGDVDVMAVLNYGAHQEWDNADGTVRCLDKFKSILQKEYPSTAMRRDRNCISMEFSEFRLDVVPAFKNTSGDYKIPDCVRKEWLWTNPFKFAEKVTTVNGSMGGRFVPLIKMVKGWNREVGWPIRSFHLECMMLNRYSGYTKGYSYDSMLKAWFDALPGYLSGAAHDPVSKQRVDRYLDNAAQKTKREVAIDTAEHAKKRAREAYELEDSDAPASIKKWKALLGEFFPSYG